MRQTLFIRLTALILIPALLYGDLAPQTDHLPLSSSVRSCVPGLRREGTVFRSQALAEQEAKWSDLRLRRAMGTLFSGSHRTRQTAASLKIKETLIPILKRGESAVKLSKILESPLSQEISRIHGDLVVSREKAIEAYARLRHSAAGLLREKRLRERKDFLPEFRTVLRLASPENPLSALWPQPDLVKLILKRDSTIKMNESAAKESA